MPTTSGVTVPDECIEDFKELKLKHKQRCIIFVIKNDREFYVHRKIGKGKGNQKEEFDAIVEEVKTDEHLLAPAGPDKESLNDRNPCVIIWDLDVPCKSGGKGSDTKMEHGVLLFMKVCPDDGVAIKKKMLMASSIETLKQKLPGIGKSVNIECMDDLNYEDVLKAME